MEQLMKSATESALLKAAFFMVVALAFKVLVLAFTKFTLQV